MDKEKLIRQLFIGKVADVIGIEKTTRLLKEATEVINTTVVKCNHLWEFIEVGSVECSECGEKVTL